MLEQIDLRLLEDLGKEKKLSQIQLSFEECVSELSTYLDLQPLYKSIAIKLINKKQADDDNYSVLDLGVNRIVKDSSMTIIIYDDIKEFLPLILLREAYYSFLPDDISDLIKICINQILENELYNLPNIKEWKNLIRDSLVTFDFIRVQLDKLEKFFKLEGTDTQESSIKWFFRYLRENPIMLQSERVDEFYDIIFEQYNYQVSQTLFNPEIVETLRVLIEIFYNEKSYLHLSDYQALFSKYKKSKKITTDLSLRKFAEHLQWINKCTSIAPSYNFIRHPINVQLIVCHIKFHPQLERSKIRLLLRNWPFSITQKFSPNGFATEIGFYFRLPHIYLHDFLHYCNKLEDAGYITIKRIFDVNIHENYINLNYFTDPAFKQRIVDPTSSTYQNRYELGTPLYLGTVSRKIQLSPFEFTLVNDRLVHFSVTGLTFDKRIETLNALKDDVENIKKGYINLTKQFKVSLERIGKYRAQFLRFIEEQQSQGLFNLLFRLRQILDYLKLVERILVENSNISNVRQLQEFLSSNKFSQKFEDQTLMQVKAIQKIVFRDFIPVYFQSPNLYHEEVVKTQCFYDMLKTCFDLKISTLKKIKRIIKEPKLADNIIHTREKEVEEIFKPVSQYKITNEKIESTIEKYLNYDPPFLFPLLINTIVTSVFAKYFPNMILKATPEVKSAVYKLRKYFPRMFWYRAIDLTTNENVFIINVYSINIQEKSLLFSILQSYFKDSIIDIKRYFWRGVQRHWGLELIDFYDFKERRFFYAEDLYSQIFVFSQKILGKKLSFPQNQICKMPVLFRSNDKKIGDLENAVKKRVYLQEIDFNLNSLAMLTEFRKNLKQIILNPFRFNQAKTKDFFKRYINAILFIPAFRKFGLSQYHLYLRSLDYEAIDFKLIFLNSFQQVQYPASIESHPALYYSYIFPNRTPNTSYLNWLIKTKRNISEYCLFFKKKFYEIIHFSRSLRKDGWDYSAIRFKSYAQNVLFNPAYDLDTSFIKKHDLDSLPESEIYGPNTPEFNSLLQIYNQHSVDMKSYLGIKTLRNFIKRGLIFPYLSIKNVSFQEKISIILPQVKKELMKKLIDIFAFFNKCHIYEIEGEVYIYGFRNIQSFENGLLIEVWFPKCEMDEFLEVFDLLFEYCGIKHYAILTDLADGKSLLTSTFGDLKFLELYNPLKNLIWNEKDKIWMNHKLFTEKFEPLYPDLLYGNQQ